MDRTRHALHRPGGASTCIHSSPRCPSRTRSTMRSRTSTSAAGDGALVGQETTATSPSSPTPPNITPAGGRMQANGGALTDATRSRVAKKASSHTAEYDGAISNYLTALNASNEREAFGEKTEPAVHPRAGTCRYGENPHQARRLLRRGQSAPRHDFILRDRSRQGVVLQTQHRRHTTPRSSASSVRRCTGLRHRHARQTPCGVAITARPCGGLRPRYHDRSTNQPSAASSPSTAGLDGATAAAIASASSSRASSAEVRPEASAAVAAKKNVRLLECGKWSGPIAQLDMKRVAGGLLVQDRRTRAAARRAEDRHRQCTDTPGMDDLLFAWRVATNSSNPTPSSTRKADDVGVGAGQMSRHQFRAHRRNPRAEHAAACGARLVMASDAFLPSATAIVHGRGRRHAKRCIQPAGSMRDDEVIAAANEHWHCDGVFRDAAFPALGSGVGIQGWIWNARLKPRFPSNPLPLSTTALNPTPESDPYMKILVIGSGGREHALEGSSRNRTRVSQSVCRPRKRRHRDRGPDSSTCR